MLMLLWFCIQNSGSKLIWWNLLCKVFIQSNQNVRCSFVKWDNINVSLPNTPTFFYCVWTATALIAIHLFCHPYTPLYRPFLVSSVVSISPHLFHTSSAAVWIFSRLHYHISCCTYFLFIFYCIMVWDDNVHLSHNCPLFCTRDSLTYDTSIAPYTLPVVIYLFI